MRFSYISEICFFFKAYNFATQEPLFHAMQAVWNWACSTDLALFGPVLLSYLCFLLSVTILVQFALEQNYTSYFLLLKIPSEM